MGLFGLFRKKDDQKQAIETIAYKPYQDDSTNFIYNLLFCDNLELYKTNIQQPYEYPFTILFSETATVSELQNIIDDAATDPRLKMLAYNRQFALGHTPTKKEILAVIIEVGLDLGLDILASFSNGTARYINQSGKIIIWETTTDANANAITSDLFAKSQQIVAQIGPWNKPRKPQPAKDMARISFLVSDGLYFGEASINTLFSDPLASAALTSATSLMQYLTQKSLEKKDS